MEQTLSTCNEESIYKHARYMNNLYWAIYGDLTMSKFCRMTDGFVSNDYMCEGCNFCGSISKEDKENEE